MRNSDSEFGSDRIHYCEYCADHYTGRHCPECGGTGVLA